jgi:hypothetical protein
MALPEQRREQKKQGDKGKGKTQLMLFYPFSFFGYVHSRVGNLAAATFMNYAVAFKLVRQGLKIVSLVCLLFHLWERMEVRERA